MQRCRRSQCKPHSEWPQAAQSSSAKRTEQEVSSRSLHWQAFEGRACERKGAIKQAMTVEAHTVRLSTASLYYRLQQRLYNSLAAQNGSRERSYGNGHRCWRWCIENERHTYRLTCSSFPLTHVPCFLLARSDAIQTAPLAPSVAFLVHPPTLGISLYLYCRQLQQT